ncbi:hypothetical protein JMJ77_0000083, partial [Colletotrichum scovillei]
SVNLERQRVGPQDNATQPNPLNDYPFSVRRLQGLRKGGAEFLSGCSYNVV